MSRGVQTFKQNDVTKACKAAARAGLEIRRVEIDYHARKISVVTGKPDITNIATETSINAGEWN
jgi:hypothetical protein